MLVCSITAMIGVAVLEPLVPALLKPLIDENFSQIPETNPLKIPLFLLTVFFFKGIAEYFSSVLSQWIANKVITDIRDDIFRHQLSLSIKNHQKESPGRIISRFLYDIPQISMSLSTAWIIIIRDTLILIALISYLLYVSLDLTMVMLVVSPPIAILINIIGKRLRKTNVDIQEKTGVMTKVINQAITGIKEIKLYAMGDSQTRSFKKISESIRSSTMIIAKLAAANVPIVQFLAALAVTVVIYLATLLSLENRFSPGEFVSFIAAMSLMFEPIRRLTGVNAVIQKGFAACQSIFNILDQKTEVIDEFKNEKVATGGNKNTSEIISFSNVCFSYTDVDSNAIANISFNINEKEYIGIVGSTGSGKSTLFNLISAFYIPQKGEIKFYGNSINELNVTDYRKKIALVGQPVTLFDDTVLANIIVGNQEASVDDIDRALELAYCKEFISKLPEKNNTIIGTNGENLSGGQRQRIAIARAIIKNASVYCFDEPTSALDAFSAEKIQAMFSMLKGKKTLIVISHDLTLLRNADRILVFDKGSLVEQGSHAELKEKRYYSKLIREQKKQH